MRVDQVDAGIQAMFVRTMAASARAADAPQTSRRVRDKVRSVFAASGIHWTIDQQQGEYRQMVYEAMKASCMNVS